MTYPRLSGDEIARRGSGAGAPGRCQTAERARAQPVPLAEDGVESTQALKPAGEGDPGDGQGRLRQKPLGEKEPIGLRQFRG